MDDGVDRSSARQASSPAALYHSEMAVQAHIRYLRQRGMGSRRIAKLAGVSRNTILILSRPEGGRRVRYETAMRIFDVKWGVDKLAEHALIPSTSAQREIDELEKLGVSSSDIQRRIQCDLPLGPWVRPSTAIALVRFHLEVRGGNGRRPTNGVTTTSGRRPDRLPADSRG